MAKKIVSPDHAVLLNAERINSVRKQPRIKEVKPFGGLILVEIFTEEEVSDSSIIMPDVAKNRAGVGGAPQGRILDIGPGIPKEAGIKVGDRVLLQGSFVPLPKLTDQRDGDRERALIEIHTIKGLLLEEKDD